MDDQQVGSCVTDQGSHQIPTTLEYLSHCPSYDPLKASIRRVDYMLSKRLIYDNSRLTLPYVGLSVQDGHSRKPLRQFMLAC
jgi:hypothetical protein